MSQLAKDMEILAADTRKIDSAIVTQVSRVLHRQLVLDTPVDTGVARSNWILSEQPVSAIIPAYRPYPKYSGPKISESENAAAAIIQGESVLSSFTGDTIYIQNNIPYIGSLNDGSSGQSPALFIENAILIATKDQVITVKVS